MDNSRRKQWSTTDKLTMDNKDKLNGEIGAKCKKKIGFLLTRILSN